MKAILICIVALFASTTMLVAHGGKKHKKDSVKVADSVAKLQEHIVGDTVHHHDEGMKVDQSKVSADLDDFPSIHPLIVHFAIALIVVAAIIQWFNLYFMKSEISVIVAVILFVCVLAAWLAGKNFHPHTHGISEHAQLVLDQHDMWADWTINTGIVATILQVLSLFVFKGKRWAAIVVAAILSASAYSVLHAGHYGAQLVHIEGIGPQGKYLEMEHHHPLNLEQQIYSL